MPGCLIILEFMKLFIYSKFYRIFNFSLILKLAFLIRIQLRKTETLMNDTREFLVQFSCSEYHSRTL